jgi:hypothetical protein
LTQTKSDPLPLSMFFGFSLPNASPSLLLGGFAAPIPKWQFVDRRFERLFMNMQYTQAQIEDYRTKLSGLERCLNANYWPFKQPNEISFIVVGSWIKNTPVRNCSDIDVLYLLPYSTYGQFTNRVGNVQSALLQEIRQVLLPSYPTTDIKGDGPTVVIDFSTVKVEIAPAFLDPTGSNIVSDPNFKTFVCHTRDGGSYSLSASIAEAQYMAKVDHESRGQLVPLMKMLKIWKKQCNVPVKTIALQMMAERFVKHWFHRNAQYYWPDWQVRDFFGYMVSQKNKTDVFPVTGEVLQFGDRWLRA